MSEHQQGGVKMDLADVKFLVKSLKADIADLRHTVEAQHRQLTAAVAERDALRAALAELTTATRAAVEGFRYAERRLLTEDGAAEMWSYCNGYNGAPNLHRALAAADAALADGDAADGR